MRTQQGPVLLICGAPASGKSTLAAQLSEAFDLPLLSRDQLKTSLWTAAGGPPNDEAFAGPAFDLFWQVLALWSSSGAACIGEAHVHRVHSAAGLDALVAAGRVGVIVCSAATESLVARAQARVLTESRAVPHQRGDRVLLERVQSAAFDPTVYEPEPAGVPLLRVHTDEPIAGAVYEEVLGFAGRILLGDAQCL